MMSVYTKIEFFMKAAGISSAFFCGGGAIDSYMNPDAPVKDIDLIIQDYEVYDRAIKRLRQMDDFDIGTVRQEQQTMGKISMSCVLKHARYGVLDLGYLSDVNQNGLFDIESLYIKLPEMQCFDPYDGVTSLKKGRAIFIRYPLEHEKAYGLLRRFAALAGKYSLSTYPNGVNAETLNLITSRFTSREAVESHPTYQAHDEVRCLSRLLQALSKTKNRRAYVEGLGLSGVLQVAFPALHDLFNQDNFIQASDLQTAPETAAVIRVMLDKADNIDGLVNCLAILTKREPERDEPEVRALINGLTCSTTAPKILSQVRQFSGRT